MSNPDLGTDKVFKASHERPNSGEMAPRGLAISLSDFRTPHRIALTREEYRSKFF